MSSFTTPLTCPCFPGGELRPVAGTLRPSQSLRPGDTYLVCCVRWAHGGEASRGPGRGLCTPTWQRSGRQHPCVCMCVLVMSILHVWQSVSHVPVPACEYMKGRKVLAGPPTLVSMHTWACEQLALSLSSHADRPSLGF